ncbi:hypothetical protein BO82DRAFT_361659 [Aspergillus uvarum CBS 121591]|uniref:Uncharacterized protein n=1 Tax=Aspergillus uvarum CBS 121591 TaxID=1448315 RepID=A0A319D413_9EURO|nr:hypothetical protein BO82DRAFT_361659 [Aspergillus uvarum CBS 121591]PYH85763.1 hypothetical protein BO82DRAFT_361659 [Aspergillus uvarum CBS 121591]
MLISIFLGHIILSSSSSGLHHLKYSALQYGHIFSRSGLHNSSLPSTAIIHPHSSHHYYCLHNINNNISISIITTIINNVNNSMCLPTRMHSIFAQGEAPSWLARVEVPLLTMCDLQTVEEAQQILTDVQANNQPIELHGMRLRLEEARGEGIHPQPIVNGPIANGHTANRHTATRHTANGPTVNGHVVLVVNGHTATGHTVHGYTAEQPAAPATPSSSSQESAQQSEVTPPASE